MKIRTGKRHIREAFKGLYRNGWMTFASVSAVTLTLLLVGVFVAVILNVNNMAQSVEDDVRINVYIDLTATEEDQATLQEGIENLDIVDSVTFSSKDDELAKLQASFGEDGAAFALFEQDNPLSDVFIVTTGDPHDVSDAASQIEELDFVTRVQYGAEDVQRLFDVVSVIQTGGFVLVGGLILIAMFLISNTIRVAIFARRTEIGIMRLVGATNGFIRFPFVLEGLLIGVLGSIIPTIVVLTSYRTIYRVLISYLQGTMFEILPLNPYGIYITLMLVGIGACIGMFGSALSIRRFLKK